MAAKSLPAGFALRQIAAARLKDVLGGQHFAPIGATELPDSRDRALANRLVTTALRRKGHLDLIIYRLLDKGMPKKSGSFEAVLRLSLAQLLYLPDLGAHSALFLAVELLKADPQARHLSGLMNALLRRAQGETALLLDIPPAQLFPPELRARWTEHYGEAAVQSFGEALLEGAPLDLTLRDDDAALSADLGASPVAFDTVRIAEREQPVEKLPGYAEGRWWVQDAGAAIPARLLRLPPEADVLDLCAAPGGKTAQLVKAGYSVTALEIDPKRMERLGSNLGRLGLHAELVTADALQWTPAFLLDGILLDAPCSATGTFRRHPEVLFHRESADLRSRVRLQRQLTERAATWLRPGGTLIYCVCSLEAEEGEGQMPWVREHLPQLALDPIRRDELGPLSGALTAEGYVRTHPAQAVHNSATGEDLGTLDGFFIARFRRL